MEFLRQYRDQADNFPAAELMNAMFGAAARFVEYEAQHSDAMVKPETRWDVPSGWSDHFLIKWNRSYVPILAIVAYLLHKP